MVDKHEEITLPIVLSCNYQSDGDAANLLI